ncbi:MAG: hypothetical protein PHI13_03500 [Methylococcales bacterium]|nr:hypothetical protein [Methylococcales bacterium]
MGCATKSESTTIAFAIAQSIAGVGNPQYTLYPKSMLNQVCHPG